MKKFFLIPLFSGLIACTTLVRSPEISTRVRPASYENLRVESYLPQDDTYESIIAPYRVQMNAQMERVLATTSINLTKLPHDNVFTQLLVDILHQRADLWAQKELQRHVDFSLLNSGGIRASIRKGDIKLRHIYEVMPFNNEMVLVEIKGADLMTIIDYFTKTRKYQPASQLSVELRSDAEANVKINNLSIQPERNYLIATSDFLAGGGDGMSFFAKGKVIPTQMRIRDVLAEGFINRKNIPFTQPENRFIQPIIKKTDAE